MDLSALAVSAITPVAQRVGNELPDKLRGLWNTSRPKVERYLRTVVDKCTHTKTLLYKDSPVDLEKIYVGTRLLLSAEGRESNEDDVVQQLESGNKIVVSATAGSGKTFFARYVFLKMLSRRVGVPIFIELRNLNDPKKTIIEYIADELSHYKIDITPDMTLEWIRSGKFVLILDGYDELAKSRASEITNEIKKLACAAHKSAMLITTRPSEDLEYLTEFRVYRIQRLDQTQAINLVKKLEYDQVVKRRFLQALESGLFEQHNDFLSNPLLLTIMLMTYGEIAEIPSKMHVFYEQAFDVLFYRHDASKGMYRRELLSGLSIDDFKSIFSCVSASGYMRSKIAYSNTELIEFIRKAKKVTGIRKLSPEDYRHDLLQAVCMLIIDGQRYVYNHRSFQEYFSALFLINWSPEKKEELYWRFLQRGVGDDALYMAFEMNRALVEREFIRPNLKKMLSMIDDSPVAAFKVWGNGLDVTWFGPLSKGRPRYQWSQMSDWWLFMCFVERAYSGVLPKSRQPSLSRILTKKSYREEFGDSRYPKKINTTNISDSDINVMERLGLMEHARRRIKFLKEIDSELKERREIIESQSIDDLL